MPTSQGPRIVGGVLFRVTGKDPSITVPSAAAAAVVAVFQYKPYMPSSVVALAQNWSSKFESDAAKATELPNQVKPVVLASVGRVSLDAKPTCVKESAVVTIYRSSVSLKD